MPQSAGPLVLDILEPGFELVWFEFERNFFGFASSMREFGAPGAGESFGFADPDARFDMSYVMNPIGGYLVDDPREKALLAAAYRSVAKLGHGQSAHEAYET